MIDTQLMTDFEARFATVVDTLDLLRKIRMPEERDGVPGIIRVLKEMREAFVTMPDLPDPDGLTRFAEGVDGTVKKVDATAQLAMAKASKRAKPERLFPASTNYAKVAACYDVVGTAWVSNYASGFVRSVLAHPCLPNGSSTDAAVDLYLVLHDAANDVGPELPVGTVLPYANEVYGPVPTYPSGVTEWNGTILSQPNRTLRVIHDGSGPVTSNGIITAVQTSGGPPIDLELFTAPLVFDTKGRFNQEASSANHWIIEGKVTVDGTDYQVEWTVLDVS